MFKAIAALLLLTAHSSDAKPIFPTTLASATGFVCDSSSTHCLRLNVQVQTDIVTIWGAARGTCYRPGGADYTCPEQHGAVIMLRTHTGERTQEFDSPMASCSFAIPDHHCSGFLQVNTDHPSATVESATYQAMSFSWGANVGGFNVVLTVTTGHITF